MRLDEIIRNPLKRQPSIVSQPYLYHGTELEYLALIIKENSLEQGAHWDKPGEPHGVRCTRKIEAAKVFAFEKEIPGGILVLDWKKISQKYKTIPHVDTQYNDIDPTKPGEAWDMDEAEEVVLTARLKPLDQYLVSILMRPKEYQELKSGEYLSKEWVTGFLDWVNVSPDKMKKSIEALMSCPLIKSL